MKLKKFNLDIGQMSKQQKTGLFIIMMVLIAGILAYKLLSGGRESVGEEEEAPKVEIQDADTRDPEKSKISAYRKNEELWEKAELEDLYADDPEDAGGRRRTVTEEDMLSEMTSQDGTRQAEQRFSGGSSSPGRLSGG